MPITAPVPTETANRCCVQPHEEAFLPWTKKMRNPPELFVLPQVFIFHLKRRARLLPAERHPSNYAEVHSLASCFAPSLFMHLLFTHRPPAATRMLENAPSVLCSVKDKRGRRAASSARGDGRNNTRCLFPPLLLGTRTQLPGADRKHC